MKTAQDNTPDRISSVCVCSGVRVWRYRFCRVGPLELVAEGLKINRKAYYDVMGVVGKIAH